MKIEIVVQCVDDGRVPRHQIINYEIKGNESRDVRMRKAMKAIIITMKKEFPKP